MAVENRGDSSAPSYFLISVSTRENLELCVRHGLAGFPSGENGAWTYCEIEKGDFISFLYGAKAHNLYRVADRQAIRDAGRLPPWKPLTFRETGKTYAFPFRLQLEPVRELTEPLVRTEFSYVAENLLLRGGYRKTHFQADQTTLQSVSEMGSRARNPVMPLVLPPYETFIPRFTRNQKLAKSPETCRFKEPILQSAIRRYLMKLENLRALLAFSSSVADRADGLEILGEKALTEGHIDLLLKQRVPLGSALKIPIEVKMDRAQPGDLMQLRGYMDELREDCQSGILIAADFRQQMFSKAAELGVKLVRYISGVDLKQAPTFDEFWQSLSLELLAE